MKTNDFIGRENGGKRAQPIAIVVAAISAVVVFILLVHFAHTLFGFGSPEHDFLIEEWAYDFITMTTALVVLASAVVRRTEKLPWALIGAGMLLWASSDLYWSAHLGKLEEAPFPSVADAGYLGGTLLVLLGVATLARSGVKRMSAIVWTDVAIGALCVAAIGTTALLNDVLTTSTGTPLQVVVAVAYPTLDLVILATAAAALALTGWRPGRGLALVAVGVAVAGVGDAVYTYQTLQGTYDPAAWNNSLWPLAAILIMAGALQPLAARRTVGEASGWRAFASPTIFAVAVFAFLVLQNGTDTSLGAILSVLTMVVIVARIALTFGENYRLVARLQQDPLTRLGNRSKLILDLRALEDDEAPDPHLLAILDLDGFKAYNDAFGHPAGDAVLTRLGGKLADTVEDVGGAYRLGGDEFAILVREDVEGAGIVAAAAVALSEEGEGFSITSSVGHAELPREATDPTNALQLADQRMYEDKDSRRPTPGSEVEAVLLSILQQRAPELGLHGNSVAVLAAEAGERLGVHEGEKLALARAAELHDIGKMAIPDAILHKPGPLNDEEWDFMRQHTILGQRIIAAAPSMAAVGKLIRSSHERWDGDGYPDRLKAEEIPLAARVVFVCDAYDAMTSDRSYAKARTEEDAIAELRRCAGTMFDPQVVEAVCDVLTSPPPAELPDEPPVQVERASTSSV